MAWEWDFDDAPSDGLVTIKNIGKHLALGVVAQFMFEDVTEANDDPLDVEGRGTFDLEIPGLREAIEAEREAEAESNSPIVTDLGFLGQVHTPSMPHMPSLYQYRLRVAWRTKAGTPKHYDSEWKTTYPPDLDRCQGEPACSGRLSVVVPMMGVTRRGRAVS